MKRLQGFTFIELLIVLAIMSIVLLAIPNLYLQQSIETLRSAASEVRLTLEEAQTRAQSNAVASQCAGDAFTKYTNFLGSQVVFFNSGGEHSINIEGSCTNGDFTYSSTPITQNYKNITITTPDVSTFDSWEVLFQKRSGLPSSTATVCVHSSIGGLTRSYIKIEVQVTGDIRQYEPSETCP